MIVSGLSAVGYLSIGRRPAETSGEVRDDKAV